MEGPTEFNVISDRGTTYEFKRVPGINEAWHSVVPLVDPAGMDSVSVEIDYECVEPTIAHANFVDFFVERYAAELWTSIEPIVQGYLEDPHIAEEAVKLTGVSVHLPAKLVLPAQWSIQYSFQSEGTHEFGLIIDFQDDEIVSAGLAD
jgi:hypothetical protein